MDIYSIYKVTNKINGKVYIGFDSKWPNRKNEHMRQTKYLGRAFNNALKKYGFDSFDWEVIYQSKDREHTLNIMEPFFIQEYNSFGSGYNMTKGGEGTFGYKRHDLAEYNRSIKGKKKNPHIVKMNQMKIPCPYCNIKSSWGNYNRWHGDKCKLAT